MIPRLIPILLAAVLGAALISRSVAQTDDSKPAAARSWQHLALMQKNSGPESELGAQINRLGREGWELVCVTPFVEDGTTMRTVYYFKRPK